MKREPLREECRGQWMRILTQLGVPPKLLNKRNQPCPRCGGRDRFRFTDHFNAGLYICTKCGGGDGFQLLQIVRGWDNKQTCREIRKVMGTIDYKFELPDETAKLDKRKAYLNEIRKALKPFTGTPVEKYLRSRFLPLNFDQKVVRYHPEMPYFDEHGKEQGKHPAMVCLVQDVDHRPVTYHVTYLDKTGAKAALDKPRKILPPVGTINGAAIRLYPLNGSGQMGIAEGVETALASFNKLGHGCPVWSCMSANGIEKFDVPDGIALVRIYADNDKSFTGQRSAYAKAYDLKSKDIDVEVIIPMEPGMDWADAVYGVPSK